MTHSKTQRAKNFSDIVFLLDKKEKNVRINRKFLLNKNKI